IPPQLVRKIWVFVSNITAETRDGRIHDIVDRIHGIGYRLTVDLEAVSSEAAVALHCNEPHTGDRSTPRWNYETADRSAEWRIARLNISKAGIDDQISERFGQVFIDNHQCPARKEASSYAARSRLNIRDCIGAVSSGAHLRCDIGDTHISLV